MVISVSTTPRSSASPASACWERRLPSNANGFVTTATVRMPISLAGAATTGAEPVPVPPPSPAVTKTMSAPSRSFLICSRSSRAAFLPTSGSAPAPRPRVRRAPSCSLTGAGEARSACKSVFATMNSTPVKRASIIRLIALDPPPPRPMTLILALSFVSSSSNTGRPARGSTIGSSLTTVREYRGRPGGSWRKSVPRPAGPGPLLEELPEPVPEFPDRPKPGARDSVIHGGAVASPARAVQRQAHTGGIDRALDHVREPADARGQPSPHGQVEDLFDQLRHALHERGAARDDDSRRGGVLEPGLGEVAGDESEDLLSARLDDLGKDLARQLARRAP